MSAANPARWRWVGAGVALAIHDFQLAEHGGSDGVRDGGAIESALMRPVDLDKPMKAHSLMQAIARANRVREDAV